MACSDIHKAMLVLFNLISCKQSVGVMNLSVMFALMCSVLYLCCYSCVTELSDTAFRLLENSCTK